MYVKNFPGPKSHCVTGMAGCWAGDILITCLMLYPLHYHAPQLSNAVLYCPYLQGGSRFHSTYLAQCSIYLKLSFGVDFFSLRCAHFHDRRFAHTWVFCCDSSWLSYDPHDTCRLWWISCWMLLSCSLYNVLCLNVDTVACSFWLLQGAAKKVIPCRILNIFKQPLWIFWRNFAGIFSVHIDI